jgi:hypothetical protein
MVSTTESLQRASDLAAEFVEASRQLAAYGTANHPQAMLDAARVALAAIGPARAELALIHSALETAPRPGLELEATEAALDAARSAQAQLVTLARALARSAMARSLMGSTIRWPGPGMRSAEQGSRARRGRAAVESSSTANAVSRGH